MLAALIIVSAVFVVVVWFSGVGTSSGTVVVVDVVSGWGIVWSVIGSAGTFSTGFVTGVVVAVSPSIVVLKTCDGVSSGISWCIGGTNLSGDNPFSSTYCLNKESNLIFCASLSAHVPVW